MTATDLEAQIAEILIRANSAHGTWGFNGTETGCRCDRGWRDAVEHRKHLADSQSAMIAPLVREAKAETLREVAEAVEAFERERGKPGLWPAGFDAAQEALANMIRARAENLSS